MDWISTTYLSEILHYVSQGLLVPDVVGLLLFIAFSLFAIGSIIVEVFTERRNFRVHMPHFLAALSTSSVEQMPDTVTASGLLNRQKEALLTLWDYRVLPPDAHIALAKRLLSSEELRYQRKSGRTDAAAKLAPMLGLMGTLIPLGPGIAALGQKDVATLASSITIAFDTTVAGLAAAFVCFIISKIRKNWYENYMVALESAMTTMLEKVTDLRSVGQLGTATPSHTADDFALAVHHHANADENVTRGIADEVARGSAFPEGGPMQPSTKKGV